MEKTNIVAFKHNNVKIMWNDMIFIHCVNVKKPAILINALIIISIVASIWYFTNCNTKKLQQHSKDIYTPHFPVNKTTYNRLKFAISLLKLLEKSEPNENTIYSPHSVYQAILLLYFGSAGKTKRELKKTLGLDWIESRADVENFHQSENINQNQTIQFKSVNKLYFSENIQIG